MKRNKQGVSLIVLVITVISTYNETIKNIQVPPKNRIKIKLINSDKVADFEVCYFFDKKYKKYDIIETK